LRKNRIDLLRQLALEVDIQASDQTFRKLINKWSETGRLDDNKSTTRNITQTKINKRKLIALDELVERKPGTSSKKALDLLPDLQVSSRTVRRYMRKLGWKVIRLYVLILYMCKYYITKIAFVSI